MVSRWARIQGVLKVKVKVKGHVIRAFVYWREKSFGCLLIGWLQQTNGEGRLIGCFMNEPCRYQTYTIRQL